MNLNNKFILLLGYSFCASDIIKSANLKGYIVIIADQLLLIQLIFRINRYNQA